MEFEGKVVLITGAAGDIGKEAARLFKERGANLSLVDIDINTLEHVSSELDLKDHLLIEADVSIENEVKNYVETTKKRFGKIDIFFNNAGILCKRQKIIETSSEDFIKVLNVNLNGVFYGLKYVMDVMVKQNYGSIINTSSLAGLKGTSGFSPYVASKHAVIGLTKTAALECADSGVRVNAICPSRVDTKMAQTLEEMSNKNSNDLYKNIPLNRYGTPYEIAELVLFLASDKASFITGSHYTIDGGNLAGNK